MKTTIDAAGRLVIPGAIRRDAGLRAGMTLEVRWQGGVIEIEPEPASVALVKKGRLTVVVPEAPALALTSETVERTRRRLRRERRGRD